MNAAIRRVRPSAVWVIVWLLAWGCRGEPVSPPSPSVEPAVAEGTGEVVGSVPRTPGAAAPIVTLEPHADLELTSDREPAEMDQYGRAFVPQLLVVQEGQMVRFINSEDELHNVNVIDESGVTIFNVGMPILGGSYDHTFGGAGDYSVACNVHQEMAALIVVTATPFATVADRNGGFVFSGVPVGTYDLVVRRGGDRDVRTVEVGEGRTELRLDDS